MFGGVFDHEAVEKRIASKEELTLAADFWSDPAKAEKVLQEIKLLKNKIEPWRDLVKTCEDLETLYELATESADDGLEDEISQTFNKAKENYEKYSILNLLSDEVDKNNAFLSIHAGAGGTEACDWAQMLCRMYIRWAERRGYKVEDLDREKITHYMTGKELDQSRRVPPLAEDAEERLRVESLTSQGGFEDVSFSVKKGEILGITGLLGSGRTEIAQALFGLLPIDSGRVYIDGEHVEVGSIGQAIKAHIGYVPEDRLTEGLFLDKSIADNVIAASIDHHTSKLNTLRKDKIRQTIAHYFESLRIKAPDVLAPVRSLSGGNAQHQCRPACEPHADDAAPPVLDHDATTPFR